MMTQVLVAFIIMLILDLSWITFMTPLYNLNFSNIQNSNMVLRISGAFVAYFLMFLTLTLFVFPAISKDPSKNKLYLALKYSGLLGFLIYGIYNATNYATFKNYSLFISIIDTLWGTTVYTLSVLITLYLL